MNQWIAWCWGTYLSPPLSEYGWTALGERALFAENKAVYTRGHFGYGLLLGRFFIGVIVSKPTAVTL